MSRSQSTSSAALLSSVPAVLILLALLFPAPAAARQICPGVGSGIGGAIPYSLQANPLVEDRVGLQWRSGSEGVTSLFCIKAQRTFGGAANFAFVMPASAFSGNWQTDVLHNWDHTAGAAVPGILLQGQVELGANEGWRYEICGALDPDHSPLQPFPNYSSTQISGMDWRCSSPLDVRVPAAASLPVAFLTGSFGHQNQVHWIRLDWQDPQRFAHGQVRTVVEKQASTGEYLVVHEETREKSPGQGNLSRFWTEEGSTLESNRQYQYRVCTQNIPVAGTDRRCVAMAVRTADTGIDPGTHMLQQHLMELSRLHVILYRDDRRTLLPEPENCLSCPWEVRMDPVREVLNRARLGGEVVLALVDSRGTTVAELGRYTPDRAGAFSSVPSMLMVASRGRMEGSTLCGLTLRVADGRGAVLGEGAMCVERGR
jgi:hypothetical protein